MAEKDETPVIIEDDIEVANIDDEFSNAYAISNSEPSAGPIVSTPITSLGASRPSLGNPDSAAIGDVGDKQETGDTALSEENAHISLHGG